MSDHTSSTSGIRLKEFRKFKRISQKELAEILGFSQPNLSKIEKGELGISRSVAERLLRKYLELNPNWLLFGTGEMLQMQSDEPMISLNVNQEYNPEDFEKIEAQYQELQTLIDQGKIPLTAVSLMFKNMRALLVAQQKLLTKMELEERIKKMDKVVKIKGRY